MDTDLIPEISVLLPAHNAEAYIAQAIESLLSQSYKNFELIIINDGSTDKTLEVIRGFSDSRIKVINNPRNLGLIATLNRGLAEARGKYTARMDADDRAFPNRLQVQHEYMELHPEVTLLGTWAHIVDAEGNFLKLHRNPLEHSVIKYELMFGNTITHPSIIFRKEEIAKAGGYDPKWPHAEDYDLYSRLIDTHMLANIPEPLIYYRQHSTSVTGTPASQEIIRENTYKIMRRNISKYVPINDHELWFITKVLTVRHPDGTLRLRDIIDAYRLHRRIYKVFIEKEKVSPLDLPKIRKYYTAHRNLMLTKYLIGKYHRHVGKTQK